MFKLTEELLYQMFSSATKQERENNGQWETTLSPNELQRETPDHETIEEAISKDINNSRVGGFHIAIYLMTALIREAYENVLGGVEL